MSVMYGADADELEQIATQFRTTADELDGEGNALTGILNRVSWLGDIATRYLDSWTGVQIPKIGMSTQFLRDAASQLDANARAQRETSEVGPGGGRWGYPLDFSVESDAGGSYSVESRGQFSVDGSDPQAAGRELLSHLLDATGDKSLIANDEIHIISVNGGASFIVVLPGVTDLYPPDPGLHSDHRSVRDLDQYAISSATSSGLDDNRYARMVSEALKRYGVPHGADIAIIGHSFGADTALDLASDSQFNGGPTGYNVTHVVAAAYHSGPQLAHVRGSTEVLVLQNDRDAVVISEMAASAPTAIIDAAADRDVLGVLGGIRDGVVDRVTAPANFVLDAGQAALRGDLNDIYLIDDGVSHPTDQQTVVVFEGGLDGLGHGTGNYSDHVRSTEDQATADFFESFANQGYSGSMRRSAIDVSVPK